MQDGKIMPVDGREKWSPMQKILHWSVVGLCLAQIPTSWAIARTHVAHHFGLAPQPVDLMLHKVHAVSGGLIFLAACLRLWLRRGAFDAGRSVEPGYRRGILDLAAAVTHACLYLLILVLPITGFLAMYVTGAAAPVHRLGIGLLWVLASLHVAAALFHAVVLRDGVLSAMLPGRWRRTPP